MVITNWLAKAEGYDGLAFPNEFATKDVQIYGNVYGNPNFADGEYVQTAVVTSYDGVKVTTAANEEYTLIKEAAVYDSFIKATSQGILIIKRWSIDNGMLIGRTPDGTSVAGKIVAQNIRKNICSFKDGRRVFVDWLSKDPDFVLEPGPEELLVFGTERCMPDVFCKHFGMFRKK